MDDKESTQIEAIDFESLQQHPQQSKEPKPRLNSKTISWIAFIALLICALMVFLFLPDYVAERREQETKAAQTEPPPSADITEEVIEQPKTKSTPEPVVELSAEEISALKQQAEKLLLQVIEKQKLLQSKAVKKWADQEFNIALSLGSNGDEHFRKQEYKQAITSYNDAIKVLTDLEKQIAPTLKKHLEKGELALTQAEKDAAILHFELAKSIQLDNTQAINGLKRAATIIELYALLEQGGKLEAANRLLDAKNSYQKATELDPLSAQAKAAFDRVTNRLAENEFNRLINQGNAALKQRQYGDARAAFKAAQKISPESKQPKQGLAAIERALRNEKLAALNAEAQHFETNQDWSNAAKSYQQMLSISPDSSSAQQGLARSQQREAILAKLNEHINNKLRLGSESVANQAKLLLQEIEALNNPGSKIEQAATTLQDLLTLANQAIAITLQSDNQTEVAIFKVGKLGKFEQRKVELKTGKYTIVGSRSGFRDVRKILTVTPDMPSKTISIRCDEPI